MTLALLSVLQSVQPTVVASSLERGIVAGFQVFAVVMALPVLGFLIRFSRDWGDHNAIVRKIDEKVDEMTDPNTGVAARCARQEMILTGDKGDNGVRGDLKRARAEVKEVSDALFRQNTDRQTQLGEWTIWRNAKDATEKVVEKRLTNVERRHMTTRRKSNPGRRETDT
jgi:hypothetical protein